VALTSLARTYRLLAVCGLLLTPNLVLFCGFLAGDDDRALKAQGRSVTGTVVGQDFRYARRGPATIDVHYRYEVNDRVYTGTVNLSQTDAKAYRVGGDIALTYLPSEPQTHCVGQPQARLVSTNSVTLVLAAAAALGFGWWLLAHEWQLRRETRLAERGHAAVGLVVDHGAVQGRHVTTYWTRYELSTPTDERATGWNNVPQIIWAQIPRGTRVTILYDPEHPSVHLPLYAFRWVRLLEGRQLTDDDAPAFEGTEVRDARPPAPAPPPSDGILSRPTLDRIANRKGRG
jgi:hypothetical protein